MRLIGQIDIDNSLQIMHVSSGPQILCDIALDIHIT